MLGYSKLEADNGINKNDDDSSSKSSRLRKKSEKPKEELDKPMETTNIKFVLNS